MSKRFLSVLCLVCGVAIFSSCSKDNDDDNSQQEENQDVNIVNDTTGTHVQGVTVSGRVGEYTFVDLGLPSGIKWATYNVGASKPTEYGDYFAWGETESKSKYIWENYKWCEDDYNSLTKYCVNSSNGKVDGLKTLLSEDDAATVYWGAGWRMPTSTEQQELLAGCDWEWEDSFNGSCISGQVGTSKTNGNTIFLPAAGYCYGDVIANKDLEGNYWSSSTYDRDSNDAYHICVYITYLDCHFTSRFYANTVRAVVK